MFEAMESEHCLQDDSYDTFETYNYGQHATTPVRVFACVSMRAAGCDASGRE